VDPKSRLNEIAAMRGSAAILSRLRWIDDRIYWTRRLARSEISRKFSISVTQASNDISVYTRLAPHNLVVLRDKRYGPAPGFAPLFDKDAKSFIEAARNDPEGFPLAIERSGDPWREATVEVVAAIIAAAVSKQPLAASSASGRLVLCPYRIVDDGSDLFVRGWDHELGRVEVYRIFDLKDPRPLAAIPWIDAAADRNYGAAGR